MHLPRNETAALVSWSTGKDSAFALHEARRTNEFDIVGLITTVTTPFGRVSMHGVREPLLERQVQGLGLLCSRVCIPSPCPNEVYEREFAHALSMPICCVTCRPVSIRAERTASSTRSLRMVRCSLVER